MKAFKIYFTKSVIRFLLLIFGFGVLDSTMKAAPTVSEADSAYLAEDFPLAIEIYNEIAEQQGVSAPLLFNLGNAYLQNGDYGNAMLCYQRAKKIEPGNKKINNNLKSLSGKIEDANKAEQKGKRKNVTEDTPNFFQSVHASVAQNTSSNSWAAWAAGSFLVFCLSVCLYLFNSAVVMRKAGFFGGIILLGISMVCLVCSFTAAAETLNREYGVILAYKAALQTEPTKTESEKNEGVLTRGTKVRIISEETDADGNVTWFKVRLNSDYIGWVPAKDMEVI